MAVKNFYLVACLIAGCLFLAYDFWLVTTGQFHPIAILGLLGWIAALLYLGTRRTQRQSESTPPLQEKD